MATFSSLTQKHVLDTLAEHDELGAEAFLAAHGFEASPDSQINHEGRLYDARAILAVAHRRATGRLATPEEFRSSLGQALTILRRRGFEVSGPTTPKRPPAAPRATRTPSASSTRKLAPEDRPAPVCPTCFVVLPATGVCDECG